MSSGRGMMTGVSTEYHSRSRYPRSARIFSLNGDAG